MKRNIIIWFCLLPSMIYGQNLIAKYQVTKTVSSGNSEGIKSFELPLSGLLYRKGSQYIYWEEPQYLNKYPKGIIDFNLGNEQVSLILSTDSVQSVFYTNFDNHIQRVAAINSSVATYENEFDDDFALDWVYKQETKTIDGLKCQLAVNSNQWSVWFCADIPCRSGIFNIRGLPGLVVEADWLAAKAHYKLISYDTQSKVADDIFNLKILKTNVVKGDRLKSNKLPREKTKEQKRLELINQNH